MIARLLFDECLSPTLVQQAHAAGHVESTCIRDRGRLSLKDHQVLAYALEHDFTLVTNNAVDFRGEGQGDPGGLYASIEIHAGLICIGAAGVLDVPTQQRLLSYVLEELAQRDDLVNKALDFWQAEDGAIDLSEYDIPP